jgi:phage shock protein PspC (stress-responsive transcriptional regulator)
MNKTININLAGIIFHLDEDAYKLLDAYLNKLKQVFSQTDGHEEIISDIEARFAELFQSNLVDLSTVVTKAMVESAIAKVGEPEMFIDSDDESETENKNHNTQEQAQPGNKKSKRKFYRNADEASVGGVCSGLAAYLGTEAWIIRALFVLMVLFGIGSGILIYIVLWIVVPEAKTTSQKLEMKGEPVTASNISKTVQEQFDNLKNTVKDGTAKNNVGDMFEKLGALILSILTIVFKVLSKVLGVVMLVAGIFMVIALLGSFFGMGNLFFDWLGNDGHTIGFSDLSDIFLVNSNQTAWILISGILFIAIPLFHIIYAGLRIVFDIEKLNNKIHWSLMGVWILAIFTLIGNGIQLAISFDNGAYTEERMEINHTGDTLQISSSNSLQWSTFENEGFDFGEVESKLANVDFNIEQSTDSLTHLVIVKRARGWNKKEAHYRAEKIEYGFRIENNTLELNDYLVFQNEDKFRGQEVDITLFLPVGKTAYLMPKTENIIDDIDNLQNIYDGNMPRHHWEMTKQGLSCTDCYMR